MLFLYQNKLTIHEIIFSVTISVISFTGTDCKLAHLGKLADTTGGQVCKTGTS